MNGDEELDASEEEYIEAQRKKFERWAKGKQVILRFKAGGRFKEEHVYDTAKMASTTDVAVFDISLTFIGHPGGDWSRPIEIGPHMIGNGFHGCAPWQLPTSTAEMESVTEGEKFTLWGRIAVSDVIEQPRTVIIEFEAT